MEKRPSLRRYADVPNKTLEIRNTRRVHVYGDSLGWIELILPVTLAGANCDCSLERTDGQRRLYWQ